MALLERLRLSFAQPRINCAQRGRLTPKDAAEPRIDSLCKAPGLMLTRNPRSPFFRVFRIAYGVYASCLRFRRSILRALPVSISTSITVAQILTSPLACPARPAVTDVNRAITSAVFMPITPA